MITLLAILGVCYVAAAVFVAIAVIKAPEGSEDELGFHYKNGPKLRQRPRRTVTFTPPKKAAQPRIVRTQPPVRQEPISGHHAFAGHLRGR